MRVCATKDPVEVVDAGHRVACWLHGPEAEIPDGGRDPLERRELSVADEA